MDRLLKRAWAEVNLDHLLHNYLQVRALLPETTKIMAIIKANAYNCGDIAVAAALEQYKDDWYGVSNLDEALTVRESGTLKSILILGYTPPEYAELIAKNSITQTIVSFDHARQMALAAEKANTCLDVHIKLDTGMSRIGVVCYDSYYEKAMKEVRWILENPFLHVTGVFTHVATFYDLTEQHDAFSRLQYQRFSLFTSDLLQKGFQIGLRHCCNSAGIINMPGMELDMVRTGTLLYGAMPLCYERRHLDLKGILTVKATVALVKEVKAGTKFSYSIQYEAANDLRAATITIGYSDILRLGMGKGQVLVNGILCPVIGSVCMDQLMIDISGAGEVRPGEEVVLLGAMGEEEIKVDDMGTFLAADTAEIYCHLTKRLPHLYIKDDKPWYWVDYIAQKHILDSRDNK